MTPVDQQVMRRGGSRSRRVGRGVVLALVCGGLLLAHGNAVPQVIGTQDSGAQGSGAQGGSAAATASPAADSPAVVSDPEQARIAFVEALAAFDRGQYGQAYDIWLPLARGGDPAAQRNIGHLYRFGLGLPQDFETAVAWYRRAADAGLARAQANLAMMYLRGQGVEQDPVTAAYWMSGAAVQGHAIAQYNLALLHLRGEGVPRNEIIATGWLYRAAQAGHEGALEALGRIIPQVTGPLGPPPPPPAWPGRAQVASQNAEDDDPVAVATPEATAPAATMPAATAQPRPTAGDPVMAAPDDADAAEPDRLADDASTATLAEPQADTKTALQVTDSSPEKQPGLLQRLGQSLIEQTSNWLKTDQDDSLERRPTQ